MRHNGSRPENRKFETTDKKVIKSKEILMEEDRVPVIGKGVRDQESPTECKCEQEGSVRNRPKSGRIQSATDEEHALDVLQTFIEDPHTSLRKAAQQHDMHPMS
ncbi:hypothetical protein J6590_101270, partial [Homalodisca vitripennis]